MELKGSTPRRRTTARALLLSPHWERYHLLTRPRVPLWALSESQARARAATLSHGPRSEVFFADSQLRARHVHRLGDRPRREPPLSSLFGQLLVGDWCCRAPGPSSFDSGDREDWFC